MADFGILSPKLGAAENLPKILLNEAFIQSDSRNVFEQYGEYKKLRGRWKCFYDADGVKIAAPTDVFAITSLNAATKTIVVTGNVLTGNTPITNGSSIRLNGGTTAANNKVLTVVGTPTFATPSSTIIVSETLSAGGATLGNIFAGATPIIKYLNHIRQSTSVEYLLCATAYHILLWTNSSKSLTVKFTCSAPTSVERWELVSHLGNVYATNNVDKILVWDVTTSPTGDFAVLDTASGLDLDGGVTYCTKAKYMISYKGYLWIGYTTEGTTVYPQRGRCCSNGEPTDWQSTGGSGDALAKDFNATSAFLMGFGKAEDKLYVFTNGDFPTIYEGWLVTADTVYDWAELQLKVGCLSADTILNDKAGNLYFLSTDMTFKEIHTPDSLSGLVDKTLKLINTQYAKYSQASYIAEYDHIYLAIPYGASITNSLLLDFNLQNKTWNIHSVPVRAFGNYTRQSVYTYDDLPYDNYNDWGLAWLKYDTDVNVVGFPLNLAADYSGNTFELHTAYTDDGTAFTGTLIFGTTLTQGAVSLGEYKRIINPAELYFNREASGTVTVSVKRDNESGWQSLGTVSLADTALPEIVCVRLPVNKRARHFLFKLESTDYFEFLGVIFPDFEFDGKN